MKKIISSLFVLSIIVVFISCKKDSNTVAPEPSKLAITASKIQGIKKDEPVLFSANTYDSVYWSANPVANIQTGSDTRSALITFSKAGTYTITAKSGAVFTTQTITVIDSSYNPGGGSADVPGYTLASLTGDEIKLSVSREDTGSHTYLTVEVETKNMYDCLNNYLIDSMAYKNSDYEFYPKNVFIPSGTQCTSGKSTAKTIFLLNASASGVHNLLIKLNGVTYNGSFVKAADGTVTFTWPYTSGITISPLVLPK